MENGVWEKSGQRKWNLGMRRTCTSKEGKCGYGRGMVNECVKAMEIGVWRVKGMKAGVWEGQRGENWGMRG